MVYDIEKEGCPLCDGSGRIWVALDSDGDVAKEGCPICIQMQEEKDNDSKKKS